MTLVLALVAPLAAQDAAPAKPASGTEWIRKLAQRSERGKLGDLSEAVRGDSGKWNDAPRLQLLPSPREKGPRQSLDDWADEAAARTFRPTAKDENWLVFRTRQLDDNDRVWIERIERRGGEFVIVLSEAIWKGNYFKTFTYYQVLAVNLGPLAPGAYKARWIVQPLEFRAFEDPGKPQDNWPKDERPAGRKAVELSLDFEVTGGR